jgi:DNA-binding transcriptional LysR family regulator
MDLLGALRGFVRVVETGSFSAVAREGGQSVSAVNRQLAQLEAHFGVRLLHRTTRRLSLTDDGQALLAHARHLLDAADDMETALGRQMRAPKGLVRLGATVAGGLFLASRLPDLLARHPGLKVELVLHDHVGDMVEERLDLALRTGDIADTSLVARRVVEVGMAVVAAPIYLERRGAPASPDDLARHECLIHAQPPDHELWRFTGPDGPIDVRVNGAFSANDSAAVLRAVRAGHGIARLPEVQMIDDFRSGRLFRLLTDFPAERRVVHVVYPSRRHLALRTRVVMEFVIEQLRESARLLAEGGEVLT